VSPGVARRLRVGERTLSGWLRAAREEGRRGPKPRAAAAAPAPVGGAGAALAELVAEQNDATLAEYADRLAERAGARRSLAAVCRALKRLAGPCAEEKARRAAEQGREDVAAERAAWRAGLAGIDPGRLIFVDETGIGSRMTRAPGRVPWGRWERLTVLGALALDGGMVASMS
jgi:transposase